MTATVTREAMEQTVEEFAAIILEADGREQATTVNWITEREPFTRRDGSRGVHIHQWPEGFERYGHRTGSEHGTSFELWPAVEKGDERVAVIINLPDWFRLYVCPTFRSALALVRENLPLVEFEMRFDLLEEIARHLAGTCAHSQQRCLVCELIDAARGRQ